MLRTFVWSCGAYAIIVLGAQEGLAGAYSNAISSDPGLVSYWRLGEQFEPPGEFEFADEKGVHNGLSAGGVSAGFAGALAGDDNTSADFSGGHIDVPDHLDFAFQGAPMSVEAWVQPDSIGGFQWAVAKDENNTNLDYLLGINPDGTFRFITQGLAHDILDQQGPRPFDGNNWYHLVGVQDSSAALPTVSLYVNGQLAGSVPFTTTGIDTLSPLRIGARNEGADQAVDGRIDEVALYSRPLSSADVLAHYNAGLNPTADYSGMVNADPGLVVYYRLGEEGAGEIPPAVDVKGLNNGQYNGSLTGGLPGALVGDTDTAVDFSGGEVNVPPSPNHDFGGSALTVECWVQPDGTGTFRWMVAKDSNNNNLTPGLDYLLGYNPDGTFRFITQGLDHDVLDSFGPRLFDGATWYHVVGVQDPVSGTVSLYVNGEAVGSTAMITSLVTSPNGLSIGDRSGFGGGQLVDGRIDEVAIYNRALSAQDIRNHYLLGIGDIILQPGDTNGDGLVTLEDLNNVRNNFGDNDPGSPGDAEPKDGVVDLDDLNLVRNNFGAGTSPETVPEPSGLLLAGLGMGASATLGRRVMRGRY